MTRALDLPVRGATSSSEDEGVALLLTLIVMLVLSALALAVTTVVDLEGLASANDRQGLTTAYAADAALERAMQDLMAMPDWTVVLAGGRASAMWDPATPVVTPWAVPLDLAALTVDLQAQADSSFGANTTRWRLFLSGPLATMLPNALPISPYLVVWVGDDGAETDGNPWADGNDRVRVHACAIGPRHLRADREVTIARDPETGVARVVSWRNL